MLSLIGVVVVIVGFALRLEPIAIIVVSAIVTAICGGIGPEEMLTIVGNNFVWNRNQVVLIILMILTGSLEKNGLKEAGANLVRKIRGLTSGMLIALYGALYEIAVIFKIPFGGYAAYVRPIMMPMTLGTIESKGKEVTEEHEEAMKTMYLKSENMGNFSGQLLFVANAGVLLIQSTLSGIGYDVDVSKIAVVQIPVAVFAFIVNGVQSVLVDRKMVKKYYPDVNKKQVQEEQR